ncbi:MAG: DUF2087 domain-containing protein [Dehalococcoidia bacterium]
MTPAEAARELGHRLDAQGRLTQWPTRRKFQRAAVFYLVAKFERERAYSEHEIGAILDLWAPFRDAAFLRRTMIEEGLLTRTPDGRVYRVGDGTTW